MNRKLANCPYCQACEIALDDHPALIFEPDAEQGSPCPHLAWIEGRFSEFEKNKHGVPHTVGSLELRWEYPHPDLETTSALESYLTELVNHGSSWTFAPTTPFSIESMSSEVTPEQGKADLYSEVDGWAIFAESPESFWSLVSGCSTEHLESLEMPSDENP